MWTAIDKSAYNQFYFCKIDLCNPYQFNHMVLITFDVYVYRLGTVNSNRVNSKLSLSSNFSKVLFATLLSFHVRYLLLIRIPINSKQKLRTNRTQPICMYCSSHYHYERSHPERDKFICILTTQVSDWSHDRSPLRDFSTFSLAKDMGGSWI